MEMDFNQCRLAASLLSGEGHKEESHFSSRVLARLRLILEAYIFRSLAFEGKRLLRQTMGYTMDLAYVFPICFSGRPPSNNFAVRFCTPPQSSEFLSRSDTSPKHLNDSSEPNGPGSRSYTSSRRPGCGQQMGCSQNHGPLFGHRLYQGA